MLRRVFRESGADVTAEGGYVDHGAGAREAMGAAGLVLDEGNCLRAPTAWHRPNDPTGVHDGAKRCHRRHPCAVTRVTGRNRSVTRVTGDAAKPAALPWGAWQPSRSRARRSPGRAPGG